MKPTDADSAAVPELNQSREEIAVIDSEIVRLLLKRVEIARRTGMLKRANGLPILDPQREAQVIRSAVACTTVSARRSPARRVRSP